MPLFIIRQDITKVNCDAIVNTTNTQMIGYSGVDLAIHKAAGPLLDAECRKIAPLDMYKAKITDGFNLPSKYIIHTSGPVWGGAADIKESVPNLNHAILNVLNSLKSINAKRWHFP